MVFYSLVEEGTIQLVLSSFSVESIPYCNYRFLWEVVRVQGLPMPRLELSPWIFLKNHNQLYKEVFEAL